MTKLSQKMPKFSPRRRVIGDITMEENQKTDTRFDLHVRYISIMSLLALITAVSLILTDVYTRSLRDRVDFVDAVFSSELDSSLERLAQTLDRAASTSDVGRFSDELSDAFDLCGRISGAASVYGKLDSTLLEKYMTSLCDSLTRALYLGACYGAVGETERDFCSESAKNIRRMITDGKDGGKYLGGKIDLILSPLL